jgi:hypothetical protein
MLTRPQPNMRQGAKVAFPPNNSTHRVLPYGTLRGRDLEAVR